MLTELKLTNFRIFDDEVTVRFRPITILIGRNSSGKSTVIKFLLVLQQSMGLGTSMFLAPEGEMVHLGTFSQLKNSLTRKRNLTFEFTVKTHVLDASDWLSDHLNWKEGDIEPSRWLFRVGAKLSYSGRANIGTARYQLIDEISARSAMSVDDPILDDSTFLVVERGPEAANSEANLDNETIFQSDRDARFERARAQFASITRTFAQHELLGTIRYHLNSIRHLSPVRDESQRVILVAPPPTDFVGQRGQYALPHLQKMTTENRGNYDFIRPYLQNIAGIDGVRFKTSSGYISQAFAKSSATGADVLIADFGFGVSQCLPVLVQGAVMAPYTSLMVEQPEAQLHPTAQLELGSYFADLWKQRKVGSIIETHSDNILLRLRRLIARGELSHEDVSVAFFTFDEENGNMPVVKNLNINEDGSMQPGLPMEFFGADIEEGFLLGARE